MDQRAIEDLFERNADMRLMERRHADIGGTRMSAEARHAIGSFGAESIVPSAAELAADETPRLRVAVAAAPMTGVIPGAVIGIAVDIHNDGGAPGPESMLSLPLPLDTEFRSGTLRLEGREVLMPERLFGTGLPIPRIPASAATKVTLQIAVLPGVHSIFLQPRLTTEGVPVVGTIGIAVRRGSLSTAIADAPVAKPFYELEDEEIEASPDAERELPIVPPLVVDEGRPAAAVAAEAPAAVPAAAAPPPAPAPAAASTNDRFRSIGPGDLALLDGLFTAEPPGAIAHYLLISTIACTRTASGDDGGAFDALVRRDRGALGRALVLARLGKPALYRVADTDLEALATAAPDDAPVPPPAPPPLASGQRQLHRSLGRAETAAIAALAQASDRDPALRLRIALLAVAGTGVEGVPDRRVADECVAMLASYRAHALAWLVPLWASSAQPEFAMQDPPANLDVAARRLIAALRRALE